jgi:hypothetical protein
MKSLRHLPVLFALLSLSACSSDDHPQPYGNPVPLRDCPEHDYTTCDTRDQECQERLLSLAACVFGSTDMPMVPIRVPGEDELREELEAEAGEAPAEDAAEDEIIEGVLHDLGLVAQGALASDSTIDDLVARFDGLYRDAERGIILIDRGTPKNNVEADVLLLHELVHALQDAEYDLAALAQQHVNSTDSALALRALVEGEATWYQYRVAAAMLGYDSADFDFSSEFTRLRDDLVTDATEDPSPYIASFGTFPYAFGTNLAYEAWLLKRAGFEAELFEAPPLTTREIINRSLGIDEPPRALHDFSDPTPTGGFSLLDRDTLGDWMLNLCFVVKGLSEVRWLGDKLWIYTNEDGDVAWLWEMQLEHTPSTLADALEVTLPNHVSVEGLGERLFVVAGAESAPFLLDAGRAFLEE